MKLKSQKEFLSARQRTHSIERQERPVSDGEKASGGSAHLHMHAGLHRLSVADGGHVDDQQVDPLLLQLVHRLVVGPHWA